MSSVKKKAEAAKNASIKLATIGGELKNKAIKSMSEAIWRERQKILEANRKDISNAQTLLEEGKYREAFVKRLSLNEVKVRSIVEMVRSVAALEDPLGRTLYSVELDEGLELYRVSSPIGVIGVVFESRPDVLPQIASLCLKSGNAVIMKGGSEAKHSNKALYSVIDDATINADMPKGWIQLVEAREDIAELLKLDRLVDLIIPRGSNDFIQYVQKNTKIPVLGHAEGICHIYVDEKADIQKSVEVCYDAKVQYPAVCNAVDTILVHRKISEKFLPLIAGRYEKANVEIRGCAETRRILKNKVKEASESDWRTEHLDLIVGIKTVNNLKDAIAHINNYGSNHTDAILTENAENAFTFMNEIDSSSVFWNASTRFSDGYRYGLGAEVGISTGKIHARGPTGLEGLTIYKYNLIGSGHIVKDYVGENAKRFTHRKTSTNWNELKNKFVK